MPENTLFSCFTAAAGDAPLDEKHTAWDKAEKVSISRYWNGKAALKEKGAGWQNMTEVKSVWTATDLYFHFCCWFSELNVNPEWATTSSVPGLWEKDVVEVFLRPESCDDYFEFEVSPLGQWLDLHIRKPRVDVDYRWSSGLRVRAAIDKECGVWSVVLAVPFSPLLGGLGNRQRPGIGDAWRLNLYRMAGEEPEREYLAWCPTFTAVPDFHVPSAFGNIIFVGE
ncbi:MAG: carbohydrate-binding family 9-like protein [Acidobacteriota bacterium]